MLKLGVLAVLATLCFADQFNPCPEEFLISECGSWGNAKFYSPHFDDNTRWDRCDPNCASFGYECGALCEEPEELSLHDRDKCSCNFGSCKCVTCPFERNPFQICQLCDSSRQPSPPVVPGSVVPANPAPIDTCCQPCPCILQVPCPSTSCETLSSCPLECQTCDDFNCRNKFEVSQCDPDTECFTDEYRRQIRGDSIAAFSFSATLDDNTIMAIPADTYWHLEFIVHFEGIDTIPQYEPEKLFVRIQNFGENGLIYMISCENSTRRGQIGPGTEDVRFYISLTGPTERCCFGIVDEDGGKIDAIIQFEPGSGQQVQPPIVP